MLTMSSGFAELGPWLFRIVPPLFLSRRRHHLESTVESASSTAHPMFGVYGLSLHPRPGPKFPGLVTRAHLGIIAKSSWAIHVYFLFSEPLL